MEQRPLGVLSVSVIGLGCNQLGTGACDEATGIRVVREAFDAGITFFDTSDEYGRDYANPSDLTGWGGSELVLGKALRGIRDEIVLATKFGPYGPMDLEAVSKIEPRSRADRKGVRIAVEECLSRLATDRIDLFQLHAPDLGVPLDETLGALDELVAEGKVREIGCSNFDGPGLVEAATLASAGGHRSFASTQSALNLLSRRALADQLPACEQLGMSFIPDIPLASGVLTGKYRRGEAAAPGTRIADQLSEDLQQRMLSEKAFDRVEALSGWAQDHGHTVLELAFAWLLGHAPVATVIAGAAKPGQAASNAAAGNWVLTPDEVAEVTAVVAAVG